VSVADTNALLRHFVEHRKLGRAARRRFEAIDSGSERCLIPAIVLVEWSMLHERGRISAGPARLFQGLAGHPCYDVLPLDVAQATELGSLAAIGDP
jgi:predicted nucleic acid-binding protein